MKMVKSLLLGSAAGVVAMAGAQAADLPVKAKPVQYVKICSLYGAGFYYIPGTDMCIKVGGWARAEYMWGANGSTVATMNGDVNNRGTQNDVWRARGYITADARNQTEYGTVRSYIAVGLSTTSTGLDNAANQFSANRVFVQLAGFTFGLAQSYYEYFNAPAVSFWGNYPDAGTGDPGWEVLGYTAQFGGGFSASLALEQRRMTQLIGGSAASTAGTSGGNLAGGGFSTSGSTSSGAGAYGGFNMPDIVANLRLDQTWGGVQIMGALHEVNATYYSSTGLENSGHPGDEWGFAVGAGGRLNTPAIGMGDYLQAQINYTQGASRYIFFNPDGNFYLQNGQQAAYGLLSDGVFGGSAAVGSTNGTSIELTTAWSVNASYEHFWTKQWRTSLYGGYAAVSYDTNANNMLCSTQGIVNGTGSGSTALAKAGCDNNWNDWWIGSRTQFNVDSATYLGVDVVYQSLQSASTANGLVDGSTIPSSTATKTGVAVSDRGNWGARFRVHRDFYP